MSKRLDTERQQEFEPKRMQHAINQLESLGFKVIKILNNNELWFSFNGSVVRFFPYSGWHTGKTIKDGRGIENLLKQLK